MLNFQSMADVNNLNVRKEGAEKDIVACDVKLSCEIVDVNVAETLIGCTDPDAKPFESFYDKKTGELKYLMFGYMQIDSEFKNISMSLGDVTFGGCTLNNFSFKLHSNRTAALNFRIQMLPDTQRSMLEVLANMVGATIKIKVESQPDLFEGKGGEDAPE